MRFLTGKRCRRVQSFGGLKFYRRENKPPQAGSAERCTQCAHERKCPWSAVKIYVRDRIAKGDKGWPTRGLTYDLTVEGVMKVLREAQIGRCAFECDNNVVDHQVVNLQYDDGVTGAFTMSSFCEGGRRTIVHGSRGILRGDMDAGVIRWMDFLTDTWHVIDLNKSSGDINDGHGGGDALLMKDWLAAIRTGDQSRVLTGPDESLETHLTTFAAEKSRLSGKVEPVRY